MRTKIVFRLGSNQYSVSRNGKIEKVNLGNEGDEIETVSTDEAILHGRTKRYRPNDPFYGSIDEIRASTSISNKHKKWVRKVWFVINVIFPIVLACIIFLAWLLSPQSSHYLVAMIALETLFIGYALVYYHIWLKNVEGI